MAGEVVTAVRERRFWILPHPDDAHGWVEARLRWMTTNEPPASRPGRPGL